MTNTSHDYIYMDQCAPFAACDSLSQVPQVFNKSVLLTNRLTWARLLAVCFVHVSCRGAWLRHIRLCSRPSFDKTDMSRASPYCRTSPKGFRLKQLCSMRKKLWLSSECQVHLSQAALSSCIPKSITAYFPQRRTHLRSFDCLQD